MNIKLGSRINNFLSGAGIVIAGVVLASSGSVLLPASSHAFPSNCTASINGSNGGTAVCGSGTGQFRAVIGCVNIFGFWENKYGPWVNVGQGASNVGCSFGYFIQWAGFNARD